MVSVLFKQLDERATVPRNAYGNDAGHDLFALEDTMIPAGVPTDVRTGIAIALPDGYYARIVHRSSAPRKKNVMVLEGIIDAGFRGELFACAYCWGSNRTQDMINSVLIKAGESIAQLVIQRVEPVTFTPADVLPESLRGEKGFGSSGA